MSGLVIPFPRPPDRDSIEYLRRLRSILRALEKMEDFIYEQTEIGNVGYLESLHDFWNPGESLNITSRRRFEQEIEKWSSIVNRGAP